MSDTVPSIHETILRQCAASDPDPWYPKLWAEESRVDREALYAPLNDLRVAGLVLLTEWVQGKGQGYTITPLGRDVLGDPGYLTQLRDGKAAKPAMKDEPIPRPTGGATRWERGEAAREAMFNPKPGRVIPALIGINVLVYMASVGYAAYRGVSIDAIGARGDIETLHAMGAVQAIDVAGGAWWRLFANCFLHFGLMHLVLNMLSLYMLRHVEALWGSGRFLVLYLTCGVCGSCAAVFVNPGQGGQPNYLAGASGAIWGIVGSAAAWVVINRTHLPQYDVRVWLQRIGFTVALNLILSALPNVSAAAHIGGGLVGVLAAPCLQYHRFGTPWHRAMAGLGLSLIPTACLLALSIGFEYDARLMPYSAAAYRAPISRQVLELMAKMEDLRKRSDALYSKPKDKRDAEAVKQVQAELREAVGKAHDIENWLKRSNPGRSAQSVYEATERLASTTVAFAELLEKRAAGEAVPESGARTKAYKEAQEAWLLPLLVRVRNVTDDQSQ